MMQNKKEMNILLSVQKYEISEYAIYLNLAKMANQENEKVLIKLAEDSLKHYRYWEKITGEKVIQNKARVWAYTNLTKIFGLTFGIKLMERTEKKSQELYENIKNINKDFTWIIEEEKIHEKEGQGEIEKEKEEKEDQV